MITDEEEEEEEYDLNFNAKYEPIYSKDVQQMCVEKEVTDETDLYQQIAEKDHYLILAAEAGKVLLEKNQQLTVHYQGLQDEYLQRIEELEQERHYLQKQLIGRDDTYESRMQDLQADFNNLSGQLELVQRTSLSAEKSQQSTLHEVTSQNASLVDELDEVKSYNKELAKQVDALSQRLDARFELSPRKSSQSSYHGEADRNNVYNQDEYIEMKALKEQVRKLLEEKLYIESTLLESTREKETVSLHYEKSLVKIARLKKEITHLKQQIDICQEDLVKTRRKNERLKDRLEEYAFLQQSMTPPQNGNRSLFNELEMSLSEADMNFQNISTPKKYYDDFSYDDIETDIPNVLVTQPEPTDADFERIKCDLQQTYGKLAVLRNKLLHQQEQQSDDVEEVDGDMLTKLVDQIICLIEHKVLSLGMIDARSNSPRTHSPTSDFELDQLSQTDSQTSDREVDILEQQVHDLNQRLNMATSEAESCKKELVVAQASAMLHEEKSQSLQIKANSNEREIEALRKEREIMMSDMTMEEKLRQALQERDEALKREIAVHSQLEESKCDMQKLNNQLLAAVEQKFALSEQLEEWQFDMASLIDQQLTSKIQREQQKTRRRSSSIIPTKFLASKLFYSRGNSRDASKSATPNRAKSPVPTSRK